MLAGDAVERKSAMRTVVLSLKDGVEELNAHLTPLEWLGKEMILTEARLVRSGKWNKK